MERDYGERGSLQATRDESAYEEGYGRARREYLWARAHGMSPTQRQLVLAFMHSARIYVAARGGKPIGGQHPDWLRGRADALRDIIREGAGVFPEGRAE